MISDTLSDAHAEMMHQLRENPRAYGAHLGEIALVAARMNALRRKLDALPHVYTDCLVTPQGIRP